MRFLIDEMFSAAVVERLHASGHDAIHVHTVGLGGSPDALIAEKARAEGRALVTENVQDFATEQDVALVFVLKRKLPVGHAQAVALAAVLDRWARANPDPLLGHHWPAS